MRWGKGKRKSRSGFRPETQHSAEPGGPRRKLTVYPAHTDPHKILEGGFDGVMLTNGPGDPKDNQEIIQNLKVIIDESELPIFGICLGHQLMALAMGRTRPS